MSLYLLLKVVHLLGVAVFAGVSFSNGFAALSAARSGDLSRIAFAFDLVVRQDHALLVPSALLLPVTGIWMAWLGGMPLWSGWLAEVLLLFLLLAILLALAIRLESRLHHLVDEALEIGELPSEFHRVMGWWSLLGAVASVGIVAMIVVMTARISLLDGGLG
ncbi:MAG: hypothetical protein CL910_06195 [Deltaproteobacteria bacterium]|jgi:uncharacterized membrane protein|nr:hypothetical protein [Deltaproteobacteria bacterium]